MLRGVPCTGVSKGSATDDAHPGRAVGLGRTAGRHCQAAQPLHQAGLQVEVLLNKARTSKTVFAALLKSSPKYGKINIYDGWYDANNNDIASRTSTTRCC